jgi:hypothetical protein
MMYDLLYRFLILHKNLYLPGIGSFILERKPAQADFLNKCIHPPAYNFSFLFPGQPESKKIFSWLAEVLHITEREAVVRLNDFAFELSKKMDDGALVSWKGVGSLTKKGDQVTFLPEKLQLTFETAVAAEKIIREQAEHTILVGEQEKTSAEMEKILTTAPSAANTKWWILPLIVFLLSAIVAGWHFYEKGWNISTLGNKQKICIRT